MLLLLFNCFEVRLLFLFFHLESQNDYLRENSIGYITRGIITLLHRIQSNSECLNRDSFASWEIIPFEQQSQHFSDSVSHRVDSLFAADQVEAGCELLTTWWISLIVYVNSVKPPPPIYLRISTC